MKNFESLGGSEKGRKGKLKKIILVKDLANSVYSTLNIFPLSPPKITRKKKNVNMVSIRNF